VKAHRRLLALTIGLLLSLPTAGALAADRTTPVDASAMARTGRFPLLDATEPGPAAPAAAASDAQAIAPPPRQVAAPITSIASGNWGSTTTWSTGAVPTAADDVTIADGHTVTLNVTAAACNRLTVGQGTSGVLVYDTTARTLTVSGDVLVAAGGALRTAATGTVTTHALVVGGSLTNDGTLDFSTNANTAGGQIRFTGAANATFGGAGGTTDIRTLVVNKGTSPASVLELNPANFTVRGAAVNTGAANGMLTLTNGTFKLGGTFSGTNTLSTSVSWTILPTAGLWLANPNYTIGALGGTLTVSGVLTMDAGTLNVGSLAGNRLTYTSGAVVNIHGGAIFVSGRFSPTSSPCTYTQTGGTLTVTTVDNASTSNSGFDLQAGSTFAMSGGTIVLQRTASVLAGPRDYRNFATTVAITGGTLQLGNASSPGAQLFALQGWAPALAWDVTGGAHNALLLSELDVYGATTIPAGSKLTLNGALFVQLGPAIVNDGTIDGSAANSALYFLGATPQTYGGGGIAGTAALPLANLDLDNGSTVTLSPASPLIVATRANLFRGTLVNSDRLQLGAGGASSAVTQIGVAANPTTGGSFDVSPVYDVGTGGYFLHYLGETAPRTTGFEIPPSRSAAFVNVSNTHEVALAGGDLAIGGTLQFAAGGKNLATGAHTVAIAAGGVVTRLDSATSGWVVGNLAKDAPLGASSRVFEVGDAASYTPVTIALTDVTAPGALTARTDAGDVTIPAGAGIDPAKSVNRTWTLTASPGLALASATGPFEFVPGDVDGGATPASFLVRRLEGGTWSGTTIGARTGTSTQASWTSGFGTFAIGETSRHAVNVTTAGSGSVAKNPDLALHDFGSSVELTATPAPNWHFAGWSGDATGNANPLTVVVDGDKNIVATFALDTHALAVTVVGNGAVAKNPDQPAYDHGSSVELTATADPGWQFAGWSGDAAGSDNPLTVVMDADRSVTATFAIDTHALNLTVVGNGTVAKNPDQTAYDHGSSVELTATAGPGWHFVAWSGDASGNDNPLTVVMTADRNLTATFAINTYALNVVVAGNGAVAKDPDQLAYDHGSSVELTATADPGWHFAGWSGDASGNANPLTLVMDADKNVTATFESDAHALNVTVSGNGAVAKNPDLPLYPHDSSVELTATADPNWHFVGWSGDASGSDNPLTVLMDADKNITATFAIDTHTLAVTIVGNGSVAKNPDQFAYDHGASVELTATADPGWHFVGWSGDAGGSDNPLTVVMDADKGVTATFALNTYALNVAVEGNGAVAKDPDQALYDHGSSVELTATADPGWHFVGWSGDASGNANPLTVVMDAGKNITATFALTTYALNVTVGGSGAVAKDPDEAAYLPGASVELTATADPNWHFVGWSGDATGNANPLTIVMDADKNITATFAIDTHALAVTIVGNGSVAKNPDQPAYDHGSSVELTATPDPGWHFFGWSGDASGTDNPLTVVMDSDKSITATFALNTYALNVTIVGNGAVAKNPDQLAYDHGSSVELTATADPNWHFVGWSGDTSGSDNPLNALMNADRNITATFAIDTHALAVTIVGSGSVAKNPDQLAYDHGSSVDLTASPDPCWQFVGWSGDASGSDNPLTVLMDAGKSVTATFAINTYALNVSAVGNGSVTRNPDQALYDHGSSVELTATADPGWHFVSWSGDAADNANPLTVVMDAEKNITATFALDTYALNVTIAGNGVVAKNPDLADYLPGASVELTATADPNWHFVGWSGDASENANPLTVVMDSDKNITATFAIDTHALAVTIVGNGSVAKNPDQLAYDHGSSVELTATTDPNWHFVGWSGDAIGSDNPLTLVMDADKSVTATFALDTHALNVTVVGNGSVGKNPDQIAYDHGSLVELTATADPNWHFVGWSGDAADSDNPLTVVMDADKNITAAFALDTHALNVTVVGNGSVAKNPDQLAYDHGSSIELTASPDPGWHFVGWSGDASGSANPLLLVIDGDKSVTATFALNLYALDVTLVGGGAVAKNPDQASYAHGASVELTATPDPGWAFAGWSGDAGGSDNPLTVVMDANKGIVATFADAELPVAHLDAPNTSGEVLVVGQSQAVTWTATDNVGVTAVDLYLSRNGLAGPFEPIALGVANSGSFDWTITGPPTETGILRVVAHDAAANAGSDDSDEPLHVVEGTVAVEPATLEFALLPVVPSPSRSVARLRFELPRDARVELGIVDVRGREVASLVHGDVPAGRHTVTWDGRTKSGRAAPGVYFARYGAGGKRFVRRIVLTP
jgi:uncharacterized repeat protein (TIGR02543 family)